MVGNLEEADLILEGTLRVIGRDGRSCPRSSALRIAEIAQARAEDSYPPNASDRPDGPDSPEYVVASVARVAPGPPRRISFTTRGAIR